MRENGKLLVTREIACYKHFSFSHNVFHCYISLVRQNAAFCVQRVNPAGNLQTAKSFDTSQPAQNAQADLCQHPFADF